VLAVIAIVLALGGTGYAISRLPKNSVGGPQLKKNAVSTKKVKDHSLRAKDFRAGQLPKGATGPPGAAGAQGAAGLQGPAGETGSQGVMGLQGTPASRRPTRRPPRRA